jgi:Tol biopolymer transport system component
MSRSHRPVRLMLLVGALAGALAAVSSVAGQGPPPDGPWLEFDTPHFRVIYQAGLEDLARHAAEVGERTHAILVEDLTRQPRGPIEMVVTDHVDFSNGYATPFTGNRIVVFARPPVGIPGLAFSRDWLELVVAHEVVHIFHLDHAGLVGRGIRSILGRIPLIWPVFPALGTPTWNIEGLATYYESRLTGGGRVHGTYHDMVIRTAALEAAIPPLRRVSAPSPVFPGAERSYVYGAALMDWIADEYGAASHRDLVQATYASVLPTFLTFDHVARQALGRPFSAIYEDWRQAATDSARALAARLEAQGLTPAETVVRRGPYAVAPRISPDGSRLSYAVHDYRSDASTEVMDLGSGAVTARRPLNLFGGILGPASWLPDGSGMVLAQLEYHGSYRIHGDLWLADSRGRTRRLTRQQRLAQPHVAPDGRRVVAVQAEDGAVRLVEHDLVTGETRVMANAAPGQAFDSPRWSPDGRSVAAARFADGQVNIVLVDAATGEIAPVTRADALDGAPAWSPDGRWVVFWSDRTGVANLHAAPVPSHGGDGPHLWQVTNVVTGAFDPEVSPDGRYLYYVAYHHDGWRIERTAFDPGTWRPASSPAVHYQPGLLAKRPSSASRPVPEGEPGQDPGVPERGSGERPPVADDSAAPAARLGDEARAYSAVRGAIPRFWAPTYQSVGSSATGQWNHFLGAYSMGWDVLQRQSWEGSIAYDVATGRLAGGTGWRWAGFGNPNLTLGAGRTWSAAGRIPLDEERSEAVLEKQDWLALNAVFLRRRWRSTAWLGVGTDLRREEYQAFRLTEQELADAGFRLPDLPTIAGLSVRPGFSNARQHPYSISAQDGITASLGLGRWWNLSDDRVAYDQVNGSIAAFRGYRLWGFSDHVAAVRVAGLLRTGDDASTASLGGAPGSTPGVLPGTGSTPGHFLPVRGFRSGDRFGTRAWVASAEYRFPIHMPGAPGRVAGLSLTSVSGALFVDGGHAWCTPGEREDRFEHCYASDDPPLVAVGAEVSITLGVIHNVPLAVRYGLALPLNGDEGRAIAFHIGMGPSF